MSILTTVLVAAGFLILLISGLWLLVVAFQRSWAWGLSLLVANVAGWAVPRFAPELAARAPFLGLIVPVASLVLLIAFLIVAWREARRPFFWYLTGLVVLVMAVFSIPGSRFSADYLASRMAGGKGAEPHSASEKLRAFFASSTPAPAASSGPASITEPASAFRSRLPPPGPAGQPEPPAPGVFYLRERVTTSTPDGLRAASPGEKVTLLKKLTKDRVLVTIGLVNFEVTNAQLTDNLQEARALEKQEYVARGGRL